MLANFAHDERSRAMLVNHHNLPYPVNEPIQEYAPGSVERTLLREEIERQCRTLQDIPLIIGGQTIPTTEKIPITCPHDHGQILGYYHPATATHAKMAITAALQAKLGWEAMPMEDRAAIFLKAADKLARQYRYVINAATMLGQSKNVHQAEIDSACELIDFFRFNVFYMQQLYVAQQALANAPHSWSRVESRPLEGFVLAISPFNFTAIGGNLATAPAMLGNVVIWKPASTAVLSTWYIMQILQESGLPDGVITMLPGRGSEISPPLMDHPALAGVHFTGSTATFNTIWQHTGTNLAKNLYRTYPRLVGETGGKGFIVAHRDADPLELSVALFRGAFEYQGQKCSAASRAYLPQSLWPEVLARLHSMAKASRVGNIADFGSFMGAVIDRAAFENIVNYIEYAKRAPDATIVLGGDYDDHIGYFIQPTVILTSNPHFKSLEEEIFGPVLTIYTYEDQRYEETLRLIDQTSPYALTGAVFSRDRFAIRQALDILKNAAGNFYINDKPTGAVVGQQPFGGARMSGTNDKAGSMLNLLRWVSPRTIKENFSPSHQHAYPHMAEEIAPIAATRPRQTPPV
jgi:1-pyrroline-5-carboxylate dehydrogenase